MNKNSLLTSQNQTDQIPYTTAQAAPKTKLTANAFNLVIISVAVVALAFSPILTKLSEIELSPTATIFNRLWMATIIIGCWQIIKPKSELEQISATEDIPHNGISSYKTKSLLILASLCATISAVFWAISFTHTSVASSTLLRSLTPLFISLGAWLILKQRFDRQFLLGMTISILGGMVIGWDDLHLGKEHLLGDGIALLSAMLHGANILIIGYLRDRGQTSSEVLLWRCGIGTLIILPLAYNSDSQIFPTSIQGWLTVLALAVVCQTFGQSLLVYSLKHFSSSFVGIFTLLKPIITAVLAWLVFTESLSLSSGIAVVLILAGIYLAKSSEPSPAN